MRIEAAIVRFWNRRCAERWRYKRPPRTRQPRKVEQDEPHVMSLDERRRRLEEAARRDDEQTRLRGE
jgi:hypothetical protein